MVDYRFSLVWGFPFFITLFSLHMVDYRLSLSSVGLSAFNSFCSRRMVDHRFLASVDLAQACPNYWWCMAILSWWNDLSS